MLRLTCIDHVRCLHGSLRGDGRTHLGCHGLESIRLCLANLEHLAYDKEGIAVAALESCSDVVVLAVDVHEVDFERVLPSLHIVLRAIIVVASPAIA